MGSGHTEHADDTDSSDWLRLDNAAKIYPASVKDASPPAFRLSVTLTSPVNAHALQRAVDTIIERTPYYRVFLKRGFFWYYLERHSEAFRVRPLPDSAITTISLGQPNQQLIRIMARGCTVAIDFSHVLTDGYGGMVFLSSVLVEYLNDLGHDIPVPEYLLDPETPVHPEEYRDAYQDAYQKGNPKADNQAPAYHIGGVPSTSGYRLITGTLRVDEALAVSREYGATLTEYIVAAKTYAISKIWRVHKNSLVRPRSSIVRVEVPVNMRKLFPSRTMRNFSLFVAPEVDLSLGDYTFPEVVKRIHHEMNIQLERNQLMRQIARNVGGERSALVRVIPRPIKYAYLGHLKRTIGNRTHSGVVSNLGRFLIPESALPHIESVRFVLGPNHAYKVGCSVVSIGSDLHVTFGSVLENRALEREFFRQMSQDGLDVRVREE